MRRSITKAAVAAAIAVSTIAFGAGAADAGLGSSLPPPGSEFRGEAAVRALGSRATSLASQLGLSRAELESMIVQDTTISVDSRGQLLFTEPLRDALSSDSAASWATTPLYSVDRTFTLHSRPQSRRTIYLDFNGHSMTGTTWNERYDIATITLRPFDLDGDQTFNVEEHALIQNAYLSVSEDFAPFDVDVTTENPGAAALRKTSTSDLDYGRRVVMTPTDFHDCGCGGEAFVDTFEGPTDTPAYVLQTRPKFVAESISHEVGHTLGLLHDGLTTGEEYYEGHGDWGPIMGNSDYRRLTQWSKGEYADANNPQDDLQEIKEHGLSGSVADRGGTPLTATSLPIGSQVVGELINSTGEVDAWKITPSKSQTVTVTVDNTFGKRVDTNLDARIRVLRADGTSLALTFKVIATASPATTTGATLSLPVVSGTTYYIYVDGVGDGSPSTTGYSNYGSIGRYNLSVSTPLTPPRLVLPPLTVER
jgi:hypothetical protein